MTNLIPRDQPTPELIVCAACKLIDTDTGKIYQVIGLRHYDLLMNKQIARIERYTTVPLLDEEQGFITNKGRFVDRTEALSIAKANDQIRCDIGYEPKELYSEMLY